MECTVYQFNGKTHCTECVNQGFNYSEKAIDNLVGDFADNKLERTIDINAFRPWCEGFSSGITLKFKYSPPKKSDIMGSLASKSFPNMTSDIEDNYSLKEFSPEYLTSTFKQHAKVNKTLTDKSQSNDSTTTISKDPTDRGSWCANVSVTKKKKQKTYPPKKLVNQEIQRVKQKYCISDYHRGKWIVTSDCCSTAKIGGAWREVCKMLKCGQLPYCNVKYQKTKQEIWIYCDVIYSLEVRKKLKVNHKLNITIPISYWVHPHGAILKL